VYVLKKERNIDDIFYYCILFIFVVCSAMVIVEIVSCGIKEQDRLNEYRMERLKYDCDSKNEILLNLNR